MTTALPPFAGRPYYPVHVDADSEPHASRGLWLVKWLLALPHYIVLAFLWTAFLVLSLVALVAILATGRYPRSIFDFNVGVMRWSWRVTYYAYGALATDKYPPFTLDEVPDYPAHLQIDYPEHLSRGLVLVKWWLLALPHWVIVALLVGGGTWAVNNDEDWRWVANGGGVIGLLAIIAAIVLAITGSYPHGLYDLILGLNRWVLRVGAYVGLMTDQYPPFRLDQGPHEPDSGVVFRQGPPPAGSPQALPPQAGFPPQVAEERPVPPMAPYAPPSGRRGSSWTAGRVVAAVSGALLAVAGLGAAASGGVALVADQVLRDGGYLTSPLQTVRSSGYAVVLDDVVVEAPGAASVVPERLIGDVRVRVTTGSADVPVFFGIAESRDAAAYLSGVARTVPNAGGSQERELTGTAPATPPTELPIWVAQASGTGNEEVVLTPRDGSWTAVVMNADGSRGVTATLDVGAEFPMIEEFGVTLLVGGLLALSAGIVLLVVAIRRAASDV